MTAPIKQSTQTHSTDTEKQVELLKRQYINDLMPLMHENGNPEWIYVGDLLKYPVETLKALLLNLKDVFTDKILNNDRSKMIYCLLQVDQSQWKELLKQVSFIMPVGTRGHDVAWATKILCQFICPSYRSKLVNVANRFFEYDTTTLDRGYILEAMSKLNHLELEAHANPDQQMREEFFAKHVLAVKEQINRIAHEEIGLYV